MSIIKQDFGEIGDGKEEPLNYKVLTPYSGYTDICNLSDAGIDTGNYVIIMSASNILNITSDNSYLTVFKLINGVITKIKSGSYSYMRVSNGVLQAHQELSSAPYNYYYYIYPVTDLS